MYIFQTPIFSFWLFIPILCAAVALLAAVKWRKNALAQLAIYSAIVAAVTTAAIPLSWGFHYDVRITQYDHRADDWLVSSLGLRSSHGGYNLFADAGNVIEPTWPWGAQTRFFVYHSDRPSPYPIDSDAISITKSDFLQKTLGFQIAWATRPYRPGISSSLGRYSITVPHWFVLLFCFPMPLLWAIRFRRSRYRLKNGLCATCGYNLSAHSAGQVCPECGTPIPFPKIAANPKSAVSPPIAPKKPV